MTAARAAALAALFSAYDEAARRAFGRVTAEAKGDGSAVTAFDRQASRMVLEALQRLTPGHGIVSEEEAEPYLPGAEWQWVVDPLDGTASFARGYPMWGLGIGLLRGGVPQEGYLRFPALDETLVAADGRMLHNARPFPPAPGPALPDTRNALVGSSFNNEISYDRLRGYKLRNMGSNLYHLACLALGRAEVVLSASCYLWDLAAALPFTRARGMVEVYLDGRPFSLAKLLQPGAGFRTEGALAIGPPAEVEAVLRMVA